MRTIKIAKAPKVSRLTDDARCCARDTRQHEMHTKFHKLYSYTQCKKEGQKYRKKRYKTIVRKM